MPDDLPIRLSEHESPGRGEDADSMTRVSKVVRIRGIHPVDHAKTDGNISERGEDGCENLGLAALQIKAPRREPAGRSPDDVYHGEKKMYAALGLNMNDSILDTQSLHQLEVGPDRGAVPVKTVDDERAPASGRLSVAAHRVGPVNTCFPAARNR